MNVILEITKETRNQDIHIPVEYNSELQLSSVINKLTTSIDDGWRVLRYRKGFVNSVDDISSYTPRTDGIVTAELQLFTYEETTGNYNVQPDIATAVSVINALNASDGFMLLDEFKGDTKIIFERPKLWLSNDESTPLGQPNGHERTDGDRY